MQVKDRHIISFSLCCAASWVTGIPDDSKFCFLNIQVPGLLKVRYIGQTTVGSAAIFGLFLGAGSLIHCGKSY